MRAYRATSESPKALSTSEAALPPGGVSEMRKGYAGMNAGEFAKFDHRTDIKEERSVSYWQCSDIFQEQKALFEKHTDSNYQLPAIYHQQSGTYYQHSDTSYQRIALSEASDALVRCSDIAVCCSDVSVRCSDALMRCSDVALRCSDVAEQPSDLPPSNSENGMEPSYITNPQQKGVA